MQDDQFSTAPLINFLKTLKSSDAHFKPIKKLISAIQSIGIHHLSFKPTTKILLFHFGMGTETDSKYLAFLDLNDALNKDSLIIPGRGYCIVKFQSIESASHFYLKGQHLLGHFRYFVVGQSQKIIPLVFFCQDTKLDTVFPNIKGCLSHYNGCIPGLYMQEQFISSEEEAHLLAFLDGQQWEKLNNRKVQHYGHRFKYGANMVDNKQEEKPIPTELEFLLDRLATVSSTNGLRFDQLTVNNYFAGDGIPPHFDTHSPFQEEFVAISMLSGIVMDFKRYDGREQSLYLNRRSLMIFSGEGTQVSTQRDSPGLMVFLVAKQTSSRRISLTFRKVRLSPCKCPYYFYCDSQGYQQENMKKNNPLLKNYLHNQNKNTKLLKKLGHQEIQYQFVEKAYNGFGHDFHNKVIDQVRQVIQQIQPGALVLDIGCGNGEYSKWIKQAYYVGMYELQDVDKNA